MWYNIRNNEAFTGLEAALVLVAFIVVASVFSYVVLSAGFFSVQKSQQVIYSAVEQGSSTIIVGDSVFGMKNSTTGNIDRIRFSLGSPYALVDIDLRQFSINVMTEDAVMKIEKAVPLFDEAEPSPGTWRIMKGDTDEDSGSILATGDYVTIMVNLPADMQITPGQHLRINVIPSLGAPVSIDMTAPQSIKDTVIF